MSDAGLTDQLFGQFSELLWTKTGITLKDYKKYLVVNRLSSLVGAGRTFENFSSLYRALLTETDGTLSQTFINALTTNYSFFFRDPIHFEVMRLYLSERGQHEPSLRFWSAASSTGEEAYSMAITLANAAVPLPNDTRILATDISTKVLERAEAGVYSSDALDRHVDPVDKARYFEAVGADQCRVSATLRRNLDFRQLNLQGAFPFTKPFDIVFLRNVMIYFASEEKEALVDKVFAHLKPGGLLFVGLSESLAGIPHRFVSYRSSVFRKPGR